MGSRKPLFEHQVQMVSEEEIIGEVSSESEH